MIHLPLRGEQKGWFVLYRTVEGRWVTRRLTTRQILRAMENEQFASMAQASRSRGAYRLLSDYPEFRDALAARRREVAPIDKPEPPQIPAPLATPSPAPKPASARRWRRRLGRVLVFLAIGGFGFWLGQLLVH